MIASRLLWCGVASIAIAASIMGSSACGPAEPATPPPAGSSAPAKSSGAPAPIVSAMVSAIVSASPSVTPGTPIVEKPPSVSFAQAIDITFPTGLPAEAERCKLERATAGANASDPSAAAAGSKGGDEDPSTEAARIRCLLRVRFAGDDAARDMAMSLYDKLGTVTGVERDQLMDGGWRGEIHLVPELPVGQYRRHLQWVKQGLEDIDSFFTGLDARRAAGTRATYRYKALELRFMRSVGRTTPSAYAIGWEVAYNVSGSLHANAVAVRETLFHEVFHTNDAKHGNWSQKALGPISDAILDKCGQKTACLAPYAPGTTMVRGGTYYAFQKGNGVGEYAAELATRYFLEHRAILDGKRYEKGTFKCGPPENAKAWKAIVDEFFGVDLTPECTVK